MGPARSACSACASAPARSAPRSRSSPAFPRGTAVRFRVPSGSRRSPRVTVRLVIADDHPVVRDGLKYLVSQNRDMVLVGEADDALQHARGLPDDGRRRAAPRRLHAGHGGGRPHSSPAFREPQPAHPRAEHSPRAPLRAPRAAGRGGRVPDQEPLADRAGGRHSPGPQRPEVRHAHRGAGAGRRASAKGRRSLPTSRCRTANTRSSGAWEPVPGSTTSRRSSPSARRPCGRIGRGSSRRWARAAPRS